MRLVCDGLTTKFDLTITTLIETPQQTLWLILKTSVK